MTTFSEVRRIRDDLYVAQDAAAKKLQSFPRGGPMGLTPDAVKFSPEFQAAKRRYDEITKAVKKINQFMTKNFKKELKDERDAIRAGKVLLGKTIYL
jgi:hypothetical protein